MLHVHWLALINLETLYRLVLQVKSALIKKFECSQHSLISGNNEQNVILWLDHRAMKETEFINSFNHPVLQYVGGKIFPEMETPKLLWLKKNLKDTWNKAGFFFDLPDFLTWRATGDDSRFI